MLSTPLFVLSCLSALIASVAAKPCVGFDSNWGLYVFGLERDVSLGPSSGWNASPLGMGNLTMTGRPPFNGPNTQCFLSQFQNSLYVLNADTTQPSNIHIFSFDSQSWTTQQISAAGTNPATLDAILDRDTNVFFALSDSVIYSLDMGALTQADGTTRAWEAVQAPPFAQNGAYPSPVMALAQNHIHFLNIGTAAQVDIFVIHFSFMQPDPQVFAPSEVGGQGFPSVHGQTASIFKTLQAVQQKFAFIPDNGSNTYIFDAIANTTQQIQGPTNHSTLMLAASQKEVVQMTTGGEVYWIPIDPDNTAANYGAAWSKIALPITFATQTSDSASNNSNNSTRSGSTTTGTHTGTTPSATTSSSAALRSVNDNPILGIFIIGLGLCGIWSSLL